MGANKTETKYRLNSGIKLEMINGRVAVFPEGSTVAVGNEEPNPDLGSWAILQMVSIRLIAAPEEGMRQLGDDEYLLDPDTTTSLLLTTWKVLEKELLD